MYMLAVLRHVSQSAVTPAALNFKPPEWFLPQRLFREVRTQKSKPVGRRARCEGGLEWSKHHPMQFTGTRCSLSVKHALGRFTLMHHFWPSEVTVCNNSFEFVWMTHVDRYKLTNPHSDLLMDACLVSCKDKNAIRILYVFQLFDKRRIGAAQSAECKLLKPFIRRYCS